MRFFNTELVPTLSDSNICMQPLNYWLCIECLSIFIHICVYFRNCLKVFVVLWTCTIVFDTSVNAAVRGDIQAMEAKQKFCGELLDRSIEILCVDMPRRLLFLESQNNENQRNPRGKGMCYIPILMSLSFKTTLWLCIVDYNVNVYVICYRYW